MRKLILVLALGAAAVIVPAGPAHASGGCSGKTILINFNPGAEAPSAATGHAHVSGNHYIKSRRYIGSGTIVTWWADHNGGLDGDTADTYYTQTFCP